MRGLHGFLLVFLLGHLSPTRAEEPAPLPEPLTLEAALAAIDPSHPLVASARSRAKLAKANRAQAGADNDLNLDLTIEGRRVEPDDSSLYPQKDDSRARLTLSKTLYDFGRTANRIEAADQTVTADSASLALAMMEIRRTVMQRYFDVVLADLEAATANEAMSIAFIRFDRGKDRYELGEISDVDLAALEDSYQTTLIDRQQAETRQRLTRNQLALALNRPGQLSTTVDEPDLPGNTAALPDFETLVEEARSNSPVLKTLKARQAAANSRKKAARAERNPELYLQLEAAEYRKQFGSRDPFTAILGLNIPLYQGSRVDADLATEEARLQQLKSDSLAADYQIQQALLEQLQTIEVLQQQIKQAEIRQDYRDLYLDRSRARYDLEIKSDLGDAMVQQTAARLFSRKIAFQLALAREELVILTANPAYSALPPTTNTSVTTKEPTP